MKNNVYPCKPHFYYIKVGFKRVNIIWACFRDGQNKRNIQNYRRTKKEELQDTRYKKLYFKSAFKLNHIRTLAIKAILPTNSEIAVRMYV